MTVLSPIEITNFTTNVPETDYPIYVPATTYALSTDVAPIKVVYAHRIWESLAGSNSGNQPDISPTWWVDTGATNAYKSIDEKVSTQTVGTDMVMSWTSGHSSKIHIMNCECQSIAISIDYDGSNLFEETQIGVYRVGVIGWFSWFTRPFISKRNFEFTIPFMPLSTTTLTTVGASKIGIIAPGSEEDVGVMQWGAKPGFIDYSKKDVNQWGETYLKEGAWSAKLSGEVIIDTDNIDDVTLFFVGRRGKASVFKATDKYDALKVYGFVREFDPLLSNPTKSTYNLIIEGLI